mgnify:CR=1 FL=1
MSSRRALPRALRPAALALAVTLAAGCVTTEPKPEEVQAQALEHAPIPAAWSSKADSAAPADTSCGRALGALADSPSLRRASTGVHHEAW